MKKISLFSFLAAALLLCVGQNAMAQTVTTGTYSKRTISADGLTSTWDFTINNGGSSNISIKNECTDNEIHFIPNGINVNKGGYLSCKGISSIYIPVPANSAGSITMTCSSSSSGRYFQLYIGDATGTESQRLNSNSKPQTLEFTSSDITTLNGVTYLLFKDNNTEMKVANFAVTLTTGAYIKLTEPFLSITPAIVNLSVSPFAKSVETSVAIKGGNLTDGNYDLTLPSVEGLTIAPTSVTVSDGALDATITLTYTSETNVEKATAETSLTIGELTEKLTINYSANVDLLAQTTVSENTTWDWTKAGATEIKLTETTAPTKNDTIVLANIDGIANNADFNSQALYLCGEYMVRDGKYFQGGYISFNIAQAGSVQVEFSNTGNRAEADRRYLYINGTKTTFGSIETGTTTTSDAIDVPAGKVEITFADAVKEQYSRVYKIIYTKGTETSFEQAAVSEKAVKVVRDGQLYILRDGKTYNAQGIVVE